MQPTLLPLRCNCASRGATALSRFVRRRNRQRCQPVATAHRGLQQRSVRQHNLPTLVNLHEPAAAGAMVGIIDYLAQCKLLEAEERDPQQWYRCTSARLRDASKSIKAMQNCCTRAQSVATAHRVLQQRTIMLQTGRRSTCCSALERCSLL